MPKNKPCLKDQNYEVVHLNRHYYGRRRQDGGGGGAASKTDDVTNSCLPPSRSDGVITLSPGAKSGVILRLDFPAGVDEHVNCSLRVKAGNG